MENNNEKKSFSFSYRDGARLVVLAGIVAFAVINLAGFLKVATNLLGILVPVIIGIFLAFILNIPMTFIETKLLTHDNKVLKKIRRPIALLASLLLLIGIVALIIILVIPQSIKAFQEISSQIPVYYQQLLDWLDRNMNSVPWLKDYIRNLDPSSANFGGNLFSSAGLMAGGLLQGITGVLGGVLNAILGLSFAGFILISKETLLHQIDLIMAAYMAPQKRGEIKYLLGVVSETFGKYITGQVTEATFVGIICTVSMLVLGFPFATVIGPLIGLSTLIPMLGAILGGAVGFLLILTINPIQALFFLLFIAVFQQLDGMFMYPRIVGKSVGLPPLWVFFSVTVGGALFGIVGVFLGVPTLAVLYRLIRESVTKRLELYKQGAITKYQILKIAKGTDPVRINEPRLLDMADPTVNTSEFLQGPADGQPVDMDDSK